ncbi:hypothetical protein BDV59DRAFT_128089 [Aspergillus ambiguus]|uniref:uncharacterized protein n=1 Tax=Aspergillus ambiguus TaxID=176160 RepID=UPI003CCD9361
MRSSLLLGASRLIFLLPLLSGTARAVDNRTCYMVDETTVAVDDVPCTTKETTHCCNKNDICMSNGLCWSQSTGDMVLSRGSCTDISWGDDCVAARPCARANPSGGYPVVNADIANHQFCCGAVLSSSSDGITCSGDGPFPVPTGTVIPGVAALASQASTSAPSCSATHPAGNSNDTSSKSPEKSDSQSSQSTKLGIGLGLGLPLGIIAGSALIWGAWERKKTASARREMDQLRAAISQNYQYAPVPQMQTPPPVEMGSYGHEHGVAELPPAGHSK